jgi:hypothetical protein
MKRRSGGSWRDRVDRYLAKNAPGAGTPASAANLLGAVGGGVAGGIVGAVAESVVAWSGASGNSEGFIFWGCLAGVAGVAGWLVLRDHLRERGARRPFSPSVFGEEATEVAWAPLHPGETAWPTHRLEDRGDKICFVGMGSGVVRHIFIGIYVLGALILYIFYKNGGSAIERGGYGSVEVVGVGLFLFLGLAQRLLRIRRTICFDRNSGRFCKKGQGWPLNPSPKEWEGDINQILALQILDKFCTDVGGRGARTGYELNLVIPSRRLNLSNHTNLSLMREEAKRLASFLGKEIWDKTVVSGDQNS